MGGFSQFIQLLLSISLRRLSKGKPNFVPLFKSHLVFLFFFLNTKKKVSGHQTHTWYLHIWCESCIWLDPELKSGFMTETRVVMIFISAVKNSILKKIYTFNIAFLELTISKRKLFF